MFVLLALFSMLAHTVQTTLLAPFYRRFDPLFVITVRGLSLFVSMSPALLFARAGSIAELGDHVPILISACAITVLGNWAAAQSFTYYQVGVATALQQGWLNLTAVILGIYFFAEVLEPVQYCAVLLIVAATSVLALSRDRSGVPATETSPGPFRPGTSQPRSSHLTGVLCTAAFGFFVGLGTVFMSMVSRSVDPLAASYFWEGGIGIAGAFIFLARAAHARRSGSVHRHDIRSYQGSAVPTRKEILMMSLCAAPTAVGTGCYAMAVTRGPFPIVAAIVSTMVVGSTLLAAVLYRERLTRVQWGAIVTGSLAVMVLNGSVAT